LDYKDLYDWAQAQSPKVSTNFIREQVLNNTDISNITERWYGFDIRVLWGLCLRGPFQLGAYNLKDDTEFLIVIARDLDQAQRRIALTKEIMHVYDSLSERANNKLKMGAIFRYLLGTTTEIGAIEKTESRAFYRALGILCPESDRQDYILAKSKGEVRDYEFAARLQVPEFVCGALRDDDFIDRLEL
jgi:hypothetical protein